MGTIATKQPLELNTPTPESFSSNQRYANVNRVAEFYDVSPATVWRWSSEGRIPKPIKLSPGCSRWRIPEMAAYGETS